jgi:D-alanyl-lipoteichoic acid acyltransferase DltB (MBOAT superfamily)
MFLIAWGLTKKLVFADNFGDIVDHVDLSTPGAGIIFTYAFALQIYCDFSAYSDIAIGSAKLFNIDLRRNFLTPYLSTSPREFWQRWHISLSTWLRDYLYIPIGGSRGDAAEITRNLIVTMTLCGLWHGAGFLFALWGFYHGVLLALYRYVPYDKYLRAILGNAFGNALAIFLTFNLVCVGWALFRAHSLAELTALWTSTTALMTFQGSAWTAFLEYFWIFLMFMIPIFATEVIGYRFDCEFPDLRDRFPMWLTVTLYIGMFYAVVWFGKRASNAFIYFQF